MKAIKDLSSSAQTMPPKSKIKKAGPEVDVILVFWEIHQEGHSRFFGGDGRLEIEAVVALDQ